MEDRIEELKAQARGEKPIEADPATGFNPAQLTSYPLARIGPRIYKAPVEAVVPSVDDREYLIVDPEEMGDYAQVDNPGPENFDNQRIRYIIDGHGYGLETIRGDALLTYQDPDPELEEMERRAQNDIFSQRDEYPNVVLATNPDRSEFEDLRKVRTALENQDITINILN